VPLTILGVHHIAIQVDDLDAARRFYLEVMGLPQIADRPDFDVDGAWFQLGAQNSTSASKTVTPPLSVNTSL
jgi:catechol 2,3-dioxygenase-like lactoylglutathione lyase family enzyme